MSPEQQARRHLLDIAQYGLKAVHGRKVVEEHLQTSPLTGAVVVIAIGKAAPAMAQGALKALGEQLYSGLVITKYGHADPTLAGHGITTIESGHPLPDGNSLRAGELLLNTLLEVPEQAQLLFLISGGASALVEVLPDELDKDLLLQTNEWLLASGLPIDAMNRIRKALSAIKAGRLACATAGRKTRVLLISDVPGDDLQVIGSGLLVSHHEEDLRINDLEPPQWLVEALNHSPPLAPAECFTHIEHHIVADNRMALQAMAERARALGIEVLACEEGLTGDVLEQAAAFVQQLKDAPAGLFIRGGETTLVLPEQPGRGGRNQSLALAAAMELEGQEGLYVLALGSDGTDGPTADAGALVDGATLRRGRLEGMDAGQYLRSADAGHFLEASQDLITTGPTGTNVMDFLLGLKWMPASA